MIRLRKLSDQQKKIFSEGCANLKKLRAIRVTQPEEERSLWLKTIERVIADLDPKAAEELAAMSQPQKERILNRSKIFNFQFFSKISDS